MSRRNGASIVIAILLGTSLASHSASAESSKPDNRQLVSMPEEAQRLLRSDMFDHLVVLNLLLGHLAASEFQQASELAEARLGNSTKGKHRGTGMGPGRFMPPGMHQLGFGMHQAATDFAEIAKNEDMSTALSALRRITNSCVACHAGFRIR
ncbi:MAG: cytochrome c [Deltaproteobacteria bacterium]|nr:cytochrome c [Deltaproteobacteria bacterium]